MVVREGSPMWGAVGRWCGAAGELHMRRIPSIRLSMGEVVGIFVGQIESRSKTDNAAVPQGWTTHLTHQT